MRDHLREVRSQPAVTVTVSTLCLSRHCRQRWLERSEVLGPVSGLLVVPEALTDAWIQWLWRGVLPTATRRLMVLVVRWQEAV